MTGKLVSKRQERQPSGLVVRMRIKHEDYCQKAGTR